MSNPSAFPVNAANLGEAGAYPAEPGMDLRDWFAAMAPTPDDGLIHSHQQMDRSRNPHNDSYKPKLRSRAEIIAMLAYEHADAMLSARKQPA